MEHNSCSGGLQTVPSSTMSSIPAIQQDLRVSPSPPQVPDARSVTSWLKSTVRRSRPRRSPSLSRPMEGLVQKLRQQTLGSREAFDGSTEEGTLASSLRRRDRLMRVLRRRDDIMMDVDQGGTGPGEQTVSLESEASHQNIGGQRTTDDTNDTSPDTICDSPNPPQNSTATRQLLIPTNHLANGSTSHHTSIEVDPTEDFSYDFWGADEGYDDHLNDTAWASNRRYLIHSMARHARSSGALNFRTSSEAALQCPRIVHKAPRMRRRRQRKTQTRLRASSTAATSLCGFDTKSDTATIESCF